MDAISGFKLLADSTDTVFSGSVGVQFSSFRDPSFSLSTELANFYNTQCNNIPPPRHPLLGDDVQVVNPSSPTPAQPTPGSPFHPPSATHLPSNGASPTTTPTPQPMKIDISSIQQHSPKPNSQPQQAASHPQQMTAPLQQQPPQHHQMQEQRVQQSPQQQPQQVQHVPQVLPQHVRLVAQQQAAAAQVQQQQQQRLAKSQDPQSARPQPNAHHTPAVVKGLINQDSSESDEEDELASMDDDGVEVRVSEMHAPLDPAMKNVLVCLIAEYLNEVITLRAFLVKVRQYLCAPDSSASNREVFAWILRCLLEGGAAGGGIPHLQRMAGFLEENGVSKQDIESSSAALKVANESGAPDFELGEKRKRREKKSISRGLRSAPNKWCKAESQLLIRLVHENGDKSWKRIAEQLGGGKTGAQCAQHWKRVLSPQIRKGSWDDLEEELLLALVERYGQSWKNIASEIKTRTDIQCRYQYQKSCLSRQCEWQAQEDGLLAKKVAQVLHENSGSNNPSRMQNVPLPVNWVEVAKFIARAKLTKIPRTALECKQRWYHINGLTPPPPVTPPPPSSSTPVPATPATITTNNFHNINYNNINSNFTMVAQPPQQATF